MSANTKDQTTALFCRLFSWQRDTLTAMKTKYQEPLSIRVPLPKQSRSMLQAKPVNSKRKTIPMPLQTYQLTNLKNGSEAKTKIQILCNSRMVLFIKLNKLLTSRLRVMFKGTFIQQTFDQHKAVDLWLKLLQWPILKMQRPN